MKGIDRAANWYRGLRVTTHDEELAMWFVLGAGFVVCRVLYRSGVYQRVDSLAVAVPINPDLGSL